MAYTAISAFTMMLKLLIYFVLPPSRKERHSSFVGSQTFLSLIKFIEKSINIYDDKLVLLNSSRNIFS
uniref:Uncharacterized protein n=1 Tax=Setaria viridis TaxID=4556 RepID=A0A4U6TPP3_SETVI|nr:hypothetical protein SEVIR_8G048244v2 [Setaria viridis]